MKILQSKYLNPIIFSLALIAQLFHAHTYFTYTSTDRNLQILGTTNHLRGEGYTELKVNPEDLSEKHYQKILGWPLGYNWMIIGVNTVLNDWFVSAEIIELLGVCFMFFVAHLILIALKPFLHPSVYPAFFFYWAITFTPFHYSTTSGEWAVCFFLLGIWGWLKASAKDFSISWFWVLLLMIPFLIAGFIRYMYYPLLFLPFGVLFVLYFFITRNVKANLLKTGIVSIFYFLLLCFFDFPTHGRTGTIIDLTQEVEIFWGNLMSMDAFPIKAFFYLSLRGLVNKLGGLGIEWVWLLKVLMLGASLFLLSLLWPKKSFKFKEPENLAVIRIWLFMVLTILATVFLLIGLSLKSPAEIYGDYKWTYVRETRYYVATLIFLQIFFFNVFFQNTGVKWKQFLLGTFLTLGLLYNLGHTGYRLGQRYLGINYRETRFAEENCMIKAQADWIQKRSIQYPKRMTVWVHEPDILMDETDVVQWYGGGAIEVDRLLENGIKSSKEIEIVIKASRKKIQQVLNQTPNYDWESLSQVTVCDTTTFYHFVYQPNREN